MHTSVDASRAGDTRPSGAHTASTLHELALQNEKELRTLMGVKRKRGSRFESDDLHLPAVRDGDVLHEDPRRHCRWTPGKVIDFDGPKGTVLKHAHHLLLVRPTHKLAAVLPERSLSVDD